MLSKLGLIQINVAILVQISQIRKVFLQKPPGTENLLATSLVLGSLNHRKVEFLFIENSQFCFKNKLNKKIIAYLIANFVFKNRTALCFFAKSF